MPKYNKYRWKGKLVSEPVYKLRQDDQRAAGEPGGEFAATCEQSLQPEQQQQREKSGRRIVELSVLGQQLWCVTCKEALSLENIENEHRRGLGSILLVRCHKCSVVNTVCTDKKHESALDDRNIRFDINFKAALGTLHTEIGWTRFNKLLACMNIPTIDFKTYKRYKDQVENIQNKKESAVLDSTAKDSCRKAPDLEELT